MNRAAPSLLRRAVAPRWLAWWAAAVVAALVCAALGSWQWGRYEDKAARADRVERHYTAPTRPVAEVLGDAPVDLSAEWTRVEAVGEYGADQLVARNRPRDGRYGYDVLAPLRLADGAVLVVDRGWIPYADSGATEAPVIPEPPRGEVTVTGWVRPGEPSLHRDPPAGQVASINLDEVARAWDEPVLGGYVIREAESPEATSTPAALDPPDTGIGPHMAYAIQWWLAIPAAFALVFFALRREEREEREELAALSEGRGDVEPAPRPRKVRVWDEEDG